MIHLQTVWEGTHTNTPERGPKETKKYGIKVPVAFDGHVDGSRLSIVMSRYGTGGTPWTIVIDKSGIVRVNEVTVRLNEEGLVRTIDKLLEEKVRAGAAKAPTR